MNLNPKLWLLVSFTCKVLNNFSEVFKMYQKIGQILSGFGAKQTIYCVLNRLPVF